MHHSGRTEFLRLITHVARAVARTPALCVVIDLGDLRRSKRVARILGPSYMDGLVRAAKSRIQMAVGPDVRVWQVDLDCFAFLLPDDGGVLWQRLVEGLVEHLRLPLNCAGLAGIVTPCVGLVRVRAGDAKAERVLETAMAAAQDARDLDVAWRFSDKATDLTSRKLHALVAGLPAALAATDQLWLAYQPRIDLQSGACLSAEALLRWNHPALGAVSPSEFIALAEQTGMIRLVTAWVVERALFDLAAWTGAGFSHGVSINVSADNLAEGNFDEKLGDAIRRHEVNPARVEIELTESALVRDSATVHDTILKLAALGVRISIDDFGVGYSNLQYLRDIPANVLKIDRSFTRDLTANDRDPVIVRSMIELAHALGCRIVAEGIENGEALEMLKNWGCDEGQGYHVSPPVTVADIQAWLSTRSDGG
jgi:EAL domain-containing protein (putative c-di-GMP-specific phosphodiesterase class I)